uniref:Uncharacterized protein n=1 Tax=Tetraodon nigroviridis TaxID=99883 RepID=H3D092_TETNG
MSKRKKLFRSQSKEKSQVFENKQIDCDLRQFTKAYQQLLMKHRQQITELELQQDNRTAEILCDHWKKLRTSWSKRFGELAKDIFIRSVPAQSNLSAQCCEELWVNLEQSLAEQLQHAECFMKLQLEAITAQLNEDEKVWSEETALVQITLKHLKVQQSKILRAMIARQSYTLNSQGGRLIEEKHEHLLATVQRLFVVRRFCLHLLQEMRLSKLKVLAQTDFRAAPMENPDHIQSCAGSTLKNSISSLAEKHLGPESLLVSHSYQQEFLSELETGTEILQNHAQLVLGNALSHSILQKMETDSQSAHKQDNSFKHHLTEAVSESVYVTKDSLTALIQSYHSNLQDIIKCHDWSSQDQVTHPLSGLHGSLLRELLNWSKKPTSTEFQHRVENHKRKMLEQCDLEQELRFEELRKKKVVQDQIMERIKTQLLEEEESFIKELAALARVSAHPEESCEEDNTGNESVAILDLLSLNPALDPALNPSLTPTVVTVSKTKPKKREQDSQS